MVPEVRAQGPGGDEQLSAAPQQEGAGLHSGAGARLVSLDVFRGITIAAMLLVNNPGSWSAIYAPLRHAEWHGWTPTDLIFPFFLFIVGTSMTFSFAARRERGVTRRALLAGVARRAAILFLLGLLLHGFPGYDFGSMRIPGVLQRIALVYLCAATLYLCVTRNTLIVMAAALLLGYWSALMLVPVPGGFTGVLEPGMDLGAWIDRTVFGESHLWSQSRTWDPEGLLSTVPAVATALLGAFAGEWLRSREQPPAKAAGLFFAGNIGIVAGLTWAPLFPINKNLWTSSYVLFTAGMACVTLAMCYWLVDVKGIRRWSTPFVVFGTNAIAAFFLSGLFSRIIGMIRVSDEVPLKTWVFRNVFASWLAPINASLAFALCFVLLWLCLMALLYRRRIFIRI